MKKLAPKPNKRQCKTSKVYYCSTIITFRMLLFKTTFLLLFFFISLELSTSRALYSKPNVDSGNAKFFLRLFVAYILYPARS